MIKLDFGTLVLAFVLIPATLTIVLATLKYLAGYNISVAWVISPLAVLGGIAVPFGIGLFISTRFVGG